MVQKSQKSSSEPTLTKKQKELLVFLREHPGKPARGIAGGKVVLYLNKYGYIKTPYGNSLSKFNIGDDAILIDLPLQLTATGEQIAGRL